MSATCFNDLIEHVGHDIVIAYYGVTEETAWNAAIECETCGHILLSFDRDGEDDNE